MFHGAAWIILKEHQHAVNVFVFFFSYWSLSIQELDHPMFDGLILDQLCEGMLPGNDLHSREGDEDRKDWLEMKLIHGIYMVHDQKQNRFTSIINPLLEFIHVNPQKNDDWKLVPPWFVDHRVLGTWFRCPFASVEEAVFGFVRTRDTSDQCEHHFSIPISHIFPYVLIIFPDVPHGNGLFHCEKYVHVGPLGRVAENR